MDYGANLLHDPGLPLGKGDVTTRLVLDEFDINLPSLATWLVVIIIIIIGSSGDTWTLDASSVTVAIASERVVRAGAVLRIGVLDVGHGATVSKA